MDNEKEKEKRRQLLERLEEYSKDKEVKEKLADRAIDRGLRRCHEKDEFNDSH